MASIQKIPLQGSRNGRPAVSYRVMYRDPEGKQRSKSFDRERDARTFKAEVESSINRGVYRDPSNDKVTFGAYAATWLETRKTTKRGSTYAVYASHVNNHLLPTLGTKRLSAIRRSDVQALMNRKAEEVAPATQAAIYGVLASIFKDAVRDRVIAYTPCEKIELRRIEQKQANPLTAEQVTALAQAIDPEYTALIITAAGTGLRIGELLGLTLDRVDWLDKRCVTVDRQLLGDGRFGPPKTAASNRSVPLPGIVGEALSEHIRVHGTAEDGRIFQMNRADLYDAWNKAIANVGLPAETTFHDLRHSYASILIEAGENPKVIQTRLGHKSITETFDTYGHLFPTSDDRTRNAIDAAFAASAPGVAVSLHRSQ